MANAYVAMGLPGSGKSTYMVKFALEIGAIYISSDDIRQEYHGNSSDQASSTEIWGIVHSRAQSVLSSGYDVVIDGTNLRRADRIKTLQACQLAKLITLMWFNTPLGVCLARNMARDRVVPDKAMHRMAQILYDEPPQQSDGYHELRIIKMTAPA